MAVENERTADEPRFSGFFSSLSSRLAPRARARRSSARVLFNILGCAFECSITPPSCLVNELNSTFGSTSSRFVSRTTSVGVNAPSATTSSPANSVLCGFCFRLCVARNRSGQSSRHHPSNHTAFERHRRLLAPPRARRTHHAARVSLASATRLAPLVSPSSSPPSPSRASTTARVS